MNVAWANILTWPRRLLMLLALPLLFAYPINATDVYRYVIRGRVASAYGQSPFVAPPAEFIGDPFMPLAGEWAGETSPYGPLWEVVAAGVTAVSGDNLLLGVVLFKLLALACFLAGGALIWAAAGERPGRVAAALLWAWNPALLLTFALNGHNDALMMGLVVFALWLAFNFLLSRTRLGRHIYATGSNREAARLSGVDVFRTTTAAYMVSSFCSCVVGLIVCATSGMGTMDAGNMYELYAVAASVIGGVSTLGGQGLLLGTVMGAPRRRSPRTTVGARRRVPPWHRAA